MKKESSEVDWDSKKSNFLNILSSIQTNIMNDSVIFNEKGYENCDDLLNEGYKNIVKYGTIKYAMLEQLRNPPYGFENMVKGHFFHKKKEILEVCENWVNEAKNSQAEYEDLVMTHNFNLANSFKKKKNDYYLAILKIFMELKEEIEKIEMNFEFVN